MEHVYTHFEQDLKEVFNSIENNLSQLEFNKTNPGGITNDQFIVFANQASDYMEEAEEIVQQLEFSAQNSGQISTIRPRIQQYTNQILEYEKRLENITGEKKQTSLTFNTAGQNQKKINFDNIQITAKEDLDDLEEEEDLDDLRIQKKPRTKVECVKTFFKYHAIKVLVIFILAISIVLIAGYVYQKRSKSNHEKPI
ncbi:hypothetical protein DICPUDRAFT_151275 [Dictyostelium purpureum]|uniref:Uncharacterized protein n=1 Tax=Dictyostelium purpureum TaxID=5786 RepID=F0ZIF7_DICPU|nr:uncharacterized protein DICPUDRAFT_151275 [Dictyostelium purpureum]EGC36275.1 hypothetical protein DICPUDRAFT_151275 [Dictyostelium purpureum]|eukprot:XP_003287221.1 hypothetical protein DICPUDRAFT_151275 [Dictyostelium purpureum]